MIEQFRNIFRVPELKRRVRFTCLLLIVYRIGGHVPTPGIDAHALALFFQMMKKYGGFIRGIRLGSKTAEFIERILDRITLLGALSLAGISILPEVLITQMNVPSFFGGTSLLIVVGVAFDTVQQIESRLLMRQYEGFLRRAKLRGRAS